MSTSKIQLYQDTDGRWRHKFGHLESVGYLRKEDALREAQELKMASGVEIVQQPPEPADHPKRFI